MRYREHGLWEVWKRCNALVYWLRAQAAHDTEVAERALGFKLAKIKPWPRGRES